VSEGPVGAATPEDLDGIVGLLRRCALPAEDLAFEHLANFVVIRCDDDIVATGGLELLGDLALFRSLAVVPELRGRRLAHRIWRAVREIARSRGVRRLYLLTTTAEALFARWGFERVPREALPETVRATQEFSALCPTTAVAMTMELASTE
jgi:amino-acid N-acetyltransferase